MIKRDDKEKDEAFLSLAMTKLESFAIIRYTTAILKGASAGINDILEMCCHPFDQVIYPISRLIYDATLIAAQHTGSTDQDLMLLHQYLQHHPEMYVEAVQRMHQLTHGITHLVNDFSEADGVLRTEMIAHVLTNILAPGYVLKSARTMIQAARSNKLQLGSILKPPVFLNRNPKAVFESIPEIDIKSILRSQTDEIGHYIYVLTTSQELRLARRTREIPLKNGYQFFHHDDLAGLQSVYAAGEFYTQNGRICGINNASGHYLPVSHASMPSMVESAFQNIGLDVSGLYYAEITPSLTELINIKRKQLIDFLAQTCLSKPSYIDSLSIAPNVLLAPNLSISELTAEMSDVLHPKDSSVSHDESNLEHTIGNVSHHVGSSLGITLAGLHFVKQHASALLHILGDIAEVIANIAHHNEADDWVENKICGTAGGLANIATKAGVVGSMAIPAINVETGIGFGVAVIAGGSTINEVLDEISTPVQKIVEKRCHITFQNRREYIKTHPKSTLAEALKAIKPIKKESQKKKEQTPPPDILPTRDRSLCGHGGSFAESLCKISPDYKQKIKQVRVKDQSSEPSLPVSSISEAMKAMMPDYLEQKTQHRDAPYQTSPDVLNPEIAKSLGHQRSPFASCIKDKLKHRFVTPHYVSQSELEKETGLLLYAITDKEKLIVAKQKSLSLDDKGNIKQASHMDLTRGKKIIAAGMMTIEHGNIISIDSHAPDYEPINIASIALQKTIERIFFTHNFPEIKDKFVYEHLSSPSKIEPLPEKQVVVNQKMPASSEPMIAVEHIALYEMVSRESTHKSNLLHVQQLEPVDFESKKAMFSKTVQQMSTRKSTPNHGDKIASNQFRSALNVSQSSIFRVSTPHHVSSLTEGIQATTPKAEKIKKTISHQQPTQQSLTYVKINDSCGLIWDDEGKPINIFER